MAKLTRSEPYLRLFAQHGDSPEAVAWSVHAQRFRFEKLCEIGPLAGAKILDVGCGLGHLYPFLVEKFGEVDYHGVDIVPEMVAHAAKRLPGRVWCQDITETPLKGRYDYVLISGVFNIKDGPPLAFMATLIQAAWERCDIALGFNFLSAYANFYDDGLAYYKPQDVFDFAVMLTPKIVLHHHYERTDTAVFLYR